MYQPIPTALSVQDGLNIAKDLKSGKTESKKISLKNYLAGMNTRDDTISISTLSTQLNRIQKDISGSNDQLAATGFRHAVNLIKTALKETASFLETI